MTARHVTGAVLKVTAYKRWPWGRQNKLYGPIMLRSRHGYRNLGLWSDGRPANPERKG